MTEVETNAESSGVRAKWQRAESGDHYVRSRFRSGAARERDSRLLAQLVRRVGAAPIDGPVLDGPVLDAPCGTGRMARAAGALARGAYVGADISASMLTEFETPDAARARATAFALPFKDRTFGAVVSCRFLHHLGAAEQRQERRAALAELARVTETWVFASWWDARSLRGRSALRRARRGGRQGTRTPCDWRELEEDLIAAGLTPRARVHSLRFVSAQAWFAAERIAP